MRRPGPVQEIAMIKEHTWPFSPFAAAMQHVAQIRHRRTVAEILGFSDRLRQCDDATLREYSLELRWRAWSGETLGRLVPQAYALVRESARRATGMAHFPVQMLAGVALCDGGIAEMQTGEGKTLTALLPAYLYALAGRGAHVVTANDYLAERDAALASAVLEPLGLAVGCINPGQRAFERRREYHKDITYSTAREIGFDFLRDRLKQADGRSHAAHDQSATSGDDESAPVQRGLYFALVDEADNILIDDARTPLVIAVKEAADETTCALYRWSVRAALDLAQRIDFVMEPGGRAIHLTQAGCLRLLRMPKPIRLEGLEGERIYRQVEQALAAVHGFTRDRQYVITGDEELAIVDESTGRILDGRKWQEGLHQAIEAKERLPITDATRTAARITVQTFFRSYAHLAGMTGTALAAAREFRHAYGKKIHRIPTHRPCQRQVLPTRVFASAAAKRRAIADDVARLLEGNRAVLLGAPSVAASEALAEEFSSRGLACKVLNCRAHRDEAAIVREAGQPGRVTIATNMAGRGTDIKVHPDVLQQGGLHVIATEMHSSRRIDQQLIGRTARQGEPGSCQFFLSLEDELLIAHDAAHLARLRQRAARSATAKGELGRGWSRLFRRVQLALESQHLRQRRELLQNERRHHEACARTGLDPYLDIIE